MTLESKLIHDWLRSLVMHKEKENVDDDRS